MKIFAIGDTHLSFNAEGKEYKPMNIFGDGWEEHANRLRENWQAVVGAEDYVLLPGDISWAMDLSEAELDFAFISSLPGKKLLLRGNHDLWWDTVSKVRKALPPDMMVLQNDCFVLEERLAVCGTRGWLCPGEQGFSDAHDDKIYAREIGRLRLSLEKIPANIEQRIVMMHYPPVNYKAEKTPFIELMEEFGVQTCIYGHLHSHAHKFALLDEKWGINFHLVSGDYLQFRPKLINEWI